MFRRDRQSVGTTVGKVRARLIQRSVALLEQLLIQSKSLERRPTIRVVHRLRVERAALSAAVLDSAA